MHPDKKYRYSFKTRRVSALVMTRIFQRWGIKPRDQLILLGLSPSKIGLLKAYEKGRPLPQNDQIMVRVSHFFHIHRNITNLFYKAPEFGQGWMLRPNNAFYGISPSGHIRRNGLVGIIDVRSKLESYLNPW